MTLKELKENVLKMIEEISDNPKVYTDDPDLEKKLNTIINQVMFEVARMKKIHKKATMVIEEPLDYDLNQLEGFYQLDHINYTDMLENPLEAYIFGNIVEFKEIGTASIYYYKYPTKITEDTDDEEYVFELSEDALEVLPYGVAGDLLKSDVSASYGSVYTQRYELMLQRLDPRYSMSMVYIDTKQNEVL